MKRSLLFLFLVLSVNIFPQRGTASVKLGHFNPSATEGGFIIGFENGRAVDPRFSFGWSIDWFHKNYVDRRLVADFNRYYGIDGGSINELRAETNIHDFPLMAVMTAKFPVAPFTKVFFTGGIGAEIMIINYNNFENPNEDDFQAAFDFNWRLGTGMIFEASRFTDFFLELTYHHSEPSWEYEVEDHSRNIERTFERSFDMSGFMARVGVKFYY
ncbi:MAG: hypothetical protein R6W90_17685 [Ignavibacteriaceae bacterium]